MSRPDLAVVGHPPDPQDPSPSPSHPVYPPLLSASQTRVVQFQPHSQGSQLEAFIGVIDLDTDARPGYNALSYCCGDSTPVCHVYLTNVGIRLPIARNLTDALARLLKGGLSGAIWIDAICIDQNNVEERNQQVRLMTRIFAGAERVLMWLASDIDGTLQRAVRLILKWANPCNDINLSLEIFYQGSNNPQSFDATAYVAHLTKETTREEWAILKAFFSRPYFRRAWIVQEVSVGRELHVLCGTCPSFSFEVLHTAAWWLTQHAKVQMLEDEHGLSQSVGESGRAVNLWTMRRHFQNDGAVPLSLLRKVYLYECYDARDKFFATHGIYDLPADIAHHFEVDYNRPLWRVCAEAVRGMIKASESLHVLTTTNWAAAPDPSFPSWVPRFDGQADDFTWDPDTDAWTSHTGKAATIPHAAPGTSPCLGQSNDPRVLSLLGIKYSHSIATAVFLCPLGFGDREHRDPSRVWEWYKWPVGAVYAALRPLTGLWTRDKREVARAFAECTTMGYRCRRTVRQHSKDSLTIFADFRAYLREWLDYGLSRPAAAKALGELGAELNVDLDAWDREDDDAVAGTANQERGLRQRSRGDMQRYYSTMIVGCDNKSLFVTQDGKIGVGPKEMKKEDEIVVLFGAARPFVVRRNDSGKQWHLVGSAWMHGLMDGDIMEGAGKAEEWFDLV